MFCENMFSYQQWNMPFISSAVCSAPRRSSLPIGCAEAQSSSSCCPEPHFRPIPEPETGSGIYLGGKIFEDGGEIDGSTGSDTLGVLAGLEKTGNTTDGELEPGFAATRLSLLRSSGTKSLSTAGHLFRYSVGKDREREALCDTEIG
nr:unknown [Ipomoea trifida]